MVLNHAVSLSHAGFPNDGLKWNHSTWERVSTIASHRRLFVGAISPRVVFREYIDHLSLLNSKKVSSDIPSSLDLLPTPLSLDEKKFEQFKGTIVNMGHHHEAHAKTKITLLASPLVSRQKVSSEASSTPSEHYDSLNHDPESSRPHQIDDEELHEMPEFQRVSIFPPCHQDFLSTRLTVIFSSSTRKPPQSRYAYILHNLNPICSNHANTVKLFYDLFFVANLTTFTSIHEINESHALTSYSGFFWSVQHHT